MSDDGEFYTMADGREDATWMRPYRQQIDALSLDAEGRTAVHQLVDEVYLHAIEDRTEEHATEHKLLGLLLRAGRDAP